MAKSVRIIPESGSIEFIDGSSIMSMVIGPGGSSIITKTGDPVTGTVIADTSANYATQTYVTTAISNLVAAAPGTLDTLNELAAALGDDPNFATTVTNSIAGKLSLSGGTLTGNVASNADSFITFGANSTWSAYLRVGGNGRTVTGSLYASVVTTNGNLHLDSGDDRATYINYYAGTAGIALGSGASSIVASMDAFGNLWKGSTIGSGTQYVYNSGTWSINVTGSAGSISGFNNPATGATANTIAYRDGNGDLTARELVITSGVQGITPTSLIGIFPTTNQAVKINAAGVQAFLGLGSLAYSSATIPTNNNQLTNGAGYITGYTETDTLQSITSRGSSTNTDISIGGTGGDRGLAVYHGSGASDYGRIRFYQSTTNISTIHSFSTAWQGGDVFVSGGALNITGNTGVTFGSWNVPDVVFRLDGISYFRNNVGFGTTNPTSPVEIINTGSAGGGYSMYSTTYAAAKAWGMRKYGIDNGQGIHWSSDVQFSSTWYNAIRIGHGQNSTNPSFQSYYTTYLATTGGNVGVGTTNPQKKFDVVGTAGIIASFGSSISPGQFAGIHFGYSESASNNDLYKKSALVFERTDSNNQAANASGKIHFLLNNRINTSANSLSDAVVTIDSDENGTVGSVRMGIGNRNPARTLDVNGNIGFAGSLFGDNKKVIDVYDSWLRLNQDGAFGSGIYSPGVFRNDGVFYNYGGIEGYNTIRSRKAQTAGDYTTAALWTESYDNTATGIAFHINGNYGGFLEMRTDRVLYWANNPVITSGNIGSYAAAINHTHDLGRYSLAAPQNVDGLTTANFRSTLFGHTNNTWNMSTARWNAVPSALSGMTSYGTMFAWAGSDTHGFIATNYDTANIQVGGGNGNLINWKATLIHDLNIGSQSVSYATTAGSANDSTKLPLAGGIMSGALLMGTGVAAAPNSQPTALSYGLLQGFGTFKIAADTDESTSEYAIITAGYSIANSTAANGLAIGYNTLTWKNNTVLVASNYNSYSPTLTGGNASGTWGISITGNAGSVGGYGVSAGVGANTVVIREGNGYVFFNYINSNVSETENPTINSFYTSNGDGYFRKASVAHVKSQLGLGSMAYEASGTYQTVSGAINTGNIGSQSVSYATTAGSAPNASNLNSVYGVSAGDGNGLKFWNGSDIYKISMGNASEYHYGPVTDYSIKTVIDSVGSTRGFTWGVNGGTPIAALNAGNGYMQIAGTFIAGQDIIAFSDKRVKENVETIDNALDKVLALRGVTYNRTDVEDKSKKIGVIAQEVQKILPEVVQEQEDGMLGVSYGNIVGVLIEAIKEQQKQIDELKALLK